MECNDVEIKVNDRGKSISCREVLALCGEYDLNFVGDFPKDGKGYVVLHRMIPPHGVFPKMSRLVDRQNETYGIYEIVGGVCSLSLKNEMLVKDSLAFFRPENIVPIRITVYHAHEPEGDGDTGFMTMVGSGCLNMKVTQPYGDLHAPGDGFDYFKGDKGDRGEKGERGETGERGNDARMTAAAYTVGEKTTWHRVRIVEGGKVGELSLEVEKDAIPLEDVPQAETSAAEAFDSANRAKASMDAAVSASESAIATSALVDEKASKIVEDATSAATESATNIANGICYSYSEQFDSALEAVLGAEGKVRENKEESDNILVETRQIRETCTALESSVEEKVRDIDIGRIPYKDTENFFYARQTFAEDALVRNRIDNTSRLTSPAAGMDDVLSIFGSGLVITKIDIPLYGYYQYNNADKNIYTKRIGNLKLGFRYKVIAIWTEVIDSAANGREGGIVLYSNEGEGPEVISTVAAGTGFRYGRFGIPFNNYAYTKSSSACLKICSGIFTPYESEDGTGSISLNAFYFRSSAGRSVSGGTYYAPSTSDVNNTLSNTVNIIAFPTERIDVGE